MKPSNAYPGIYSDELKAALGMTEGAPPPWLINMQRYGPPPSYPSLKIPGLNAPIPHGAEFGYHPGGWGKPPVDHHGHPLYGDVFGMLPQIEDDLDPQVRPSPPNSCRNLHLFLDILFIFPTCQHLIGDLIPVPQRNSLHPQGRKQVSDCGRYSGKPLSHIILIVYV
jgi:hypothetical protein